MKPFAPLGVAALAFGVLGLACRARAHVSALHIDFSKICRN
jgi:hypothetical protein